MVELATILAANALVLGVLAYLVRNLLRHLLDKDVEQFKSTLQLRAAVEIEAYRARLEKDRLRLQISYGGIFEKQAQAILDLYDAVLNLEEAAGVAIHFGGDIRERKRTFLIAVSNVRKAHYSKRILLPPPVDVALNELYEKISRGGLGFFSAEGMDLSRMDNEEVDRLFAKQDRAFEILEEQVPLLKERLVKEMRHVIGVVLQDESG